MLFYRSKLIFSGFLQFKGDFERRQDNSKYRDWAHNWIVVDLDRFVTNFAASGESKLLELIRIFGSYCNVESR